MSSNVQNIAMATPRVSSLNKGLRLLSAIIADEGRSTLTAIAARLGLPLATAHRLSLTLVDMGFLERGRKGYYYKGLALGSPKDLTSRLAAILRTPLSRLAQRQKVVAHFGIFENGMVTYLVRENGTAGNFFTEEKSQLEAYYSAIGKILLASLPRSELDAYLSMGPFVALTTNTLTETRAIREELDRVRKDGVAFDRFEVREDIFCIGVPIYDRNGATIGSISASTLNERPDRARISSLRQALSRIATNLEKTGVP